MKPKIKFDAAALKKGALEHGEKVAFGLTVIVLLMFCWSALNLKVLEAAKQPDPLKQTARDVTDHVARSAWETKDEKGQVIQVVDYLVRSERKPVPAEAYHLAVPFNPALADKKSQRENPALFAAEEVRVSAGFGSFAFKAPAAVATDAGGAAAARPGSADSGPLKGQAWVVITGLVPVEKQRREYARVFDRAMGENKNRDVPQYRDVKIERAEIKAGNPEQLEWTNVTSASDKVEKQFASVLPEIVPQDFVDRALTWSLGPLQGETWGESVSHPKIPTSRDHKEQIAVAVPEKSDVVMRGGDEQEPSKSPAPQPIPQQPVKPVAQGVDYLLLRAFDYTAEPNKRYRYRVSVRLANPNFGVPDRFLKEPDPQAKSILETKPSQPTPAVTVPDGYRVFAGLVAQKPGELTAKMVVSVIDKQQGIEAYAPLDVLRGTVANTFVKEAQGRDPRSKAPAKLTNVDFKSGMVVVDIHGGKPLQSAKKVKFNVPGEVLLMDLHGNLFVRNEMDDVANFDSRVPVEEPEKKDKPADPQPVKRKPRSVR